MKTLFVRTLTGIVFVALVVTTFFAPPAFFHIVFLFFTVVGTQEFISMASNKEESNLQFAFPCLATVTLYSAFQLMIYSHKLSLILFILAIILMLSVPVVELYRKSSNPISNIAISLFPVLWIGVPFGLIGMWAHLFDANSLVLALLIIIWLYDTLAYCGGSLFGKHRLFERISPKKSWEGFIISLIMTTGIAGIFHFIPFFNNVVFSTIWHWFGFAVIIIVTSTFGDLVESLFKRSVNVKDSGNILPGHGGVLDRFDSFLFAAPAGFLYWLLFYLW